MTVARKFKQAVRARSRKTGESYTAARHQLLKARRRPAAEPPPAVPPRPTPPRPRAARPGLSDRSVLAKTGHALDHWFAVLDAFGAAARGHTASARHLALEHGIPGWHAQGITVAYERERGLRVTYQTSTGFQVSVSKVVPATVREVADALRAAGRRGWLDGADAALRTALAEGVRAPSKGIVIRSDGVARLRYRWDGSTVEMRIEPRPRGASVAVGNIGLPDADAVERRRAQWRGALEALKTHLAR